MTAIISYCYSIKYPTAEWLKTTAILLAHDPESQRVRPGSVAGPRQDLWPEGHRLQAGVAKAVEVTGLVSVRQQVSRFSRSCKTFLSLGSDGAIYHLRCIVPVEASPEPGFRPGWEDLQEPLGKRGTPCSLPRDRDKLPGMFLRSQNRQNRMESFSRSYF